MSKNPKVAHKSVGPCKFGLVVILCYICTAYNRHRTRNPYSRGSTTVFCNSSFGRRPYLRMELPDDLGDGAKRFRAPVIPRNNLRSTSSHASWGWWVVGRRAAFETRVTARDLELYCNKRHFVWGTGRHGDVGRT